MTTKPPPLPPTLIGRFIGWYRIDHGRWQPVIADDDRDTAWTKLLDVRLGVSSDKVVLERGQKP